MIYEYRSEDNDFFQSLLSKGTTIMVFSAPWCGTCRAIQRTMREFSEKHSANILYVNVDQEKSFSEQYHIQGIPVILLLEDGISIGKTAGSLDYEEFCDWMEKTRNNRSK